MASNELTDKEAEIYDRQIRLWGVEAQRRLRAARVLLAGFNALGAEIAKNTILAGINVVIQDDKVATLADSGSNFFLSDSDVGQNVRLQSRCFHCISSEYV
jgi:ubiquitin-like 1-activating enzyme E1 A